MLLGSDPGHKISYLPELLIVLDFHYSNEVNRGESDKFFFENMEFILKCISGVYKCSISVTFQ